MLSCTDSEPSTNSLIEVPDTDSSLETISLLSMLAGRPGRGSRTGTLRVPIDVRRLLPVLLGIEVSS
jgi:hypothetical protein